MNKLKTNKIIGIKGSYMRMKVFITFRFRSSNFFRNFEVIGSCHNTDRMKTVVFLVSSGHIIGELSLMLLLDTARYCVTSPEGEMLLLQSDECLRLTLLGFFLSSPDVIKETLQAVVVRRFRLGGLISPKHTTSTLLLFSVSASYTKGLPSTVLNVLTWFILSLSTIDELASSISLLEADLLMYNWTYWTYSILKFANSKNSEK
uniref:Uncharacterized protein n=1 Tax=Glossina austeni TaxID=7395 RepID=A0A1A9UW53_GLOAU